MCAYHIWYNSSMRKVATMIAIILLASNLLGQSSRPETDTPIPLVPIEPEFPADILAKFHNSERIDLFVEVNFRGFVVGVEAFGPWFACGTPDIIPSELQKAAINAVKQTRFIPGLRRGQPADAPLVVTLVIKGTQPSPASSELKVIKGDLKNGQAIYLPKPKYPSKARDYRVEDNVSIQVSIDESGGVVSVRAKSGHPLLLKAAATAACNAQFSPTLAGGVPMKVSGLITYNFVL